MHCLLLSYEKEDTAKQRQQQKIWVIKCGRTELQQDEIHEALSRSHCICSKSSLPSEGELNANPSNGTQAAPDHQAMPRLATVVKLPEGEGVALPPRADTELEEMG